MAVSRVLPTLGNPAYPQLDYDALVAAGVHVPEFIEKRMDGDFSFDLSDPVTFRSRNNSKVLDTTGKSFLLEDNNAGKYIRLESGGQNGLIGPTPDAREMTYAGVWNYRAPDPADTTQVLAGTSTAAGGEQLQVSTSGSITLDVKGYGSVATISAAVLSAAGIEYSTNLFVFVGVTSEITEGDETRHTLLVGAASGVLTTTSIGTKTLADENLSVGNAYRSGTLDAMRIRCARFMSASRSSTVAGLTGMYLRAKVVASRRGVTVR